MQIDRNNAPYVLTKPFHHSQKLSCRNPDGSINITICVHHNYEIERLILGFGGGILVLRPKKLRKRIVSHLKSALNQYEIPQMD